MVTFVTVNWHNYCGRGAEYVNKLFNMVARNLPEKHKYVCFTDDPTGINPEIETPELPDSLRGWWNKLYLFKPGLFEDGERIVYLDLDTIIVGSLDEIIKYDGDFAICRDFFNPDTIQSGFMMWRGGFGAEIWESFVKWGYPNIEGGDQQWIARTLPEVDIVQKLYPRSFVSYKVHAERMFPKQSKVVCFHGLPRPHEVEGWVPHVWKLDGGTALEMVHAFNVTENDLVENIESALKLPYPRVKDIEPHDGHAVIMGGGPSLKAFKEEICWRKMMGQTLFATNNTHSVMPCDYHIMLDARSDNVAFVPDFDNVKCLYASQCHPSVFEKAKGKDIQIWHSFIDGIQEIVKEDASFVGAGLSTVGLKAMALAYTLGYREMHIYGMDSSYSDGEHHAYKQPLNDGERIIEVELNGQKYTCASWMATQAEEFKVLAALLTEAGCTLTIHGTGLLPDLARLISTQKTAAQLRGEAILSRLGDNPVGVEVGVFAGQLSMILLQKPDLKLYMVDSWAISEPDSDYAKSGDFHSSLTQAQQDEYCEYTKSITSQFGERANVIRKTSIKAAKDIPDHSLDFVFIDADHSYNGCKADIQAWLPKVKKGGLLSGHDYENTSYPCFGVEKAVDEFAAAHGYIVELGDNFTWFIRI